MLRGAGVVFFACIGFDAVSTAAAEARNPRRTVPIGLIGLASTVLVTLYGQTRIFMRMSEDGMLPPRFGKVNPRTKTPQFSIVLCGVVGGIVAGLVPLSVLGELISIGTLLAFIIVSAGVLRLRRAHPELPRPFRVPALPLVAGTAIVASIALMATLPGATWIRLAI